MKSTNLEFYSANQAETYWCKLNAKTLLGAKRECNKDYDDGSRIEIAIVDTSFPEECRQFETIAVRTPYDKKWIGPEILGKRI